MVKPQQLALQRLVAQGIAVPLAEDAATAVTRMTALQAQDLPGALASIALRTERRSHSDVRSAFAAGEIVRSWPMRGTLHIVPAVDLRWMLALTADRIIAATARRRVQLDITDSDIAHARSLAVDALSGGNRLTRAELQQVWESHGQSTTGQRGYHLIMQLCVTGILCFGPLRDKQQELVLLDEWVPEKRTQSLGEWALRYFHCHGPATAKDFAWWTKLRAADIKTAITSAATKLDTVDIEGTTYYFDPDTPKLLEENRSAARTVFLLPGFDEFLLGYTDRSAALPAEFAGRVVPGGNGMFLPTVVSGGQVIGTWKRQAKAGIAATPFTTFARGTETAIQRQFAALPS